jgi:dUTP pyrophosphatase
LDIIVDNGATSPTRGTEHAAGYDLYVHRIETTNNTYNSLTESIRLETGWKYRVYTGVRMAIPVGYYGLLAERSSTQKFGVRLTNSVGVIDSDYRGEIILTMECFEHIHTVDGLRQYKWLKEGDKIAQIIFHKYHVFDLNKVKILPSTDRGNGGFGSTGRENDKCK